MLIIFSHLYFHEGYSILHLSDPRPAYARENLREAYVKVNVSAEHLSADMR